MEFWSGLAGVQVGDWSTSESQLEIALSSQLRAATVIYMAT
jgi:hypothetical protein